MPARTVSVLPVLLVLLALLTAAPPAVTAGAKSGDLKLKVGIRRDRRKVAPGQGTIVTLKIKNRADAARTVRVSLSLDIDPPGMPFAVRDIPLDAGERRRVDTPLVVPAELADRNVRVIARAEGLEDRTKVKVRRRALPKEQWIRGRDLYRTHCADCHGDRGADIRFDRLDEWVEAMRDGPGSMPAFDVPEHEINTMLQYLRDRERF